jgi:hypothetical protein
MSKKKITLLALCALLLAGGVWDYFRYANRTNAAAVWGWLVTRQFEWSHSSTDVVTELAAWPELKSLAGSGKGFADPAVVVPREGARPSMVRGVPHRQIDQHPDAANRKRLEERLASLQDFKNSPLPIKFSPSLWELTGAQALIAQGCEASNGCRADLVRTKGEFSHLHSHDGSAHMMLAPADAKLALERGWAEVFPIAGGLGGRIPWIVLVYAPRNPQEEQVFMHLLQASAQHALSKQP